MECTPIGTVSTPFDTTEAAPRQGIERGAEGAIEVDERYADGLEGIEAGDELVVVWFAHEADRSLLRVDRRGRGVFATRSPARPNPICLSPCTVLAVEGRRLRVRGVDMLDGSPVLDLKPRLRGSTG